MRTSWQRFRIQVQVVVMVLLSTFNLVLPQYTSPAPTPWTPTWTKIGETLGRSILQDAAIVPGDRTTIDTVTVHSLVGSSSVLRFQCGGESQPRDLKDKQVHQFVLMKKYGPSKEYRCSEIAILDEVTNKTLKSRQNVLLTLLGDATDYNVHHVYFYGYGWGSYSGIFGMWVYDGRW